MPENTARSPRRAPLIVFVTVFAPVFLFVVVTSTIVTFILPESFAGTARILVGSDRPTVCEIIQSQAVLGPVIDKLQLSIEWGKKYNGGETLKTSETMEFLKGRMEILPERDARLIDITVYSEDRNEAARIANAIADGYNDHCRDLQKQTESDHSVMTLPKIEIVDRAAPQPTPARPNKPLNLALGVLMGIVLGSLMGGISAYIISRLGRPLLGKATPP
jgi:capsular polysaccharide biosynthesis protein